MESTPDGKSHIAGQLTRRGVSDDWQDVVPIYAHIGNKTTRLGTIGVVKNDQQFDTILPMKVGRVTIDDEEDCWRTYINKRAGIAVLFFGA